MLVYMKGCSCLQVSIEMFRTYPFSTGCRVILSPKISKKEQCRTAEQQQQSDESEASLLLLHVLAVFHEDEQGLVGAHVYH